MFGHRKSLSSNMTFYISTESYNELCVIHVLTVSTSKNIGLVNVSTPVDFASEAMIEPISVVGEKTDSAVNFDVRSLLLGNRQFIQK